MFPMTAPQCPQPSASQSQSCPYLGPANREFFNYLRKLCHGNGLVSPAQVLRLCLLMGAYKGQIKKVLKVPLPDNIPHLGRSMLTQTKHSLGWGLILFSKSQNSLPDSLDFVSFSHTRVFASAATEATVFTSLLLLDSSGPAKP